MLFFPGGRYEPLLPVFILTLDGNDLGLFNANFQERSNVLLQLSRIGIHSSILANNSELVKFPRGILFAMKPRVIELFTRGSDRLSSRKIVQSDGQIKISGKCKIELDSHNFSAVKCKGVSEVMH